VQKLIFLLIFLSIIHQDIFSQDNDSVRIEKNPLLTDRYVVNMGFFVNSKAIVFNIDGSLPSNPIDFGKTLGLSKQESTFALSFNWRFSKNKKWSFGFEYFSENNKRTAVLEDEIKWGNTIYPVGVQLDAGFGFQMYGLFVGRVISMGEKHELLGGLGIHTLDIGTFIQAKAYLGDSDFELDTDRKRANAIAPIPGLGLRYLYAPHIKWSLSARVDFFSISLDDYSGTLWNLAPSVSFQVFDNFGVGLGYKYFEANIDMNKNNWRGSTDLSYQGPLFSISGNF